MSNLHVPIWTFSLLALIARSATGADTLAQRLLTAYDDVQTLTVDARKDILSGEDRIRMLSRVWFERPDKLRVENSEPLKRLILSDGANFHMTVAGHERGLRQPVGSQDATQLAALRTVPGTAMENLWRLANLPEVELPPTPEWPLRRGYAAERHFVVLALDDAGRLSRIDFFDGPGMEQHRGEIVFDDFAEPLPGVWIPRLHRSRIRETDIELREIRRFSNLVVNHPIDPERFDAGGLDDVKEWVEDMETFLAP